MKYLGLSNDTLLIDAQVKFVNKDINRARQLLLKAHSYFPNDPTPLFSLAFLDFWEGKYDNGKKYLAEGIKKQHSLPGDQLNSIIIWYEMALKENSSNLHLHYPLGRLYYLQGNYSLAEDSFKKILEIYKNDKNQMHYEAERYIRKISKKVKK